MNRLPCVLFAAVICLAGCGKKEEPSTAVPAPAPPPSKAVESAPPAAQPTAGQLAQDAGAVKEPLPEAKLPEAVQTATALAGAIDWSSFSWDKVATVPYSGKDQLASWAVGQVDSWKNKLTQAALAKGAKSLLGMGGDSGWQSALTGVVSAVNKVRESSPETWELARGALVSAWDKFQKEAEKYLGQG